MNTIEPVIIDSPVECGACSATIPRHGTGWRDGYHADPDAYYCSRSCIAAALEGEEPALVECQRRHVKQAGACPCQMRSCTGCWACDAPDASESEDLSLE